MKNLPLLIGTLVITIVIIVGVVIVFSSQNNAQIVVADQNLLINDDSHAKGQAEALITLVEFSDFQCPACKSAAPLVQGLLNTYPDKIRFIYRHFPLNAIHFNAQLAAQAAEAAAVDNKFWEYHDLLFARQTEWADLKTGEPIETKFAQYAQELGIDKVVFLERIKSDHIKSLVIEDLNAGNVLNIKGTPTFYVNGQPVSAPQLLQTVESIINS